MTNNARNIVKATPWIKRRRRETTRLLKKASECFEGLSMNGISSMTSNPPFVLSPVEGLR